MNPQVLEAFREDGKRLRSLRDRKSTRLNSSHSQISYAVSFDRKSTRLNSSHSQMSYAVFCLKKKRSRPQKSSVVVKNAAGVSFRSRSGNFAITRRLDSRSIRH